MIGTNIQWEIYNLYKGERKADPTMGQLFYIKTSQRIYTQSILNKKNQPIQVDF